MRITYYPRKLIITMIIMIINNLVLMVYISIIVRVVNENVRLMLVSANLD